MSQFAALQALVALDEQGSLTAAAEHLYASKSSISRRIAKLEEDLATPLTLEEKGRLVLSRAGLLYLDYARQILAIAQESQSALQQLSQEVSGEIRVRLCPDLSSGWIVTALNEFVAAYPKVSLSLASNGKQAHVRDKDDVFLVCGQPGQLEGFKCIPLGAWQRRLYVSKQHACPANIEELARMPWIGRPDDRLPIVLKHSQTGQQVSLRPDMRMQAATLNMLAEALAGGYGIGLLPSWVAECKRYGKRDTFTRCLSDWVAEPIQLSAYIRQQDRSYSVRMLISFLQNSLPSRWSIAGS